MTDRYAALRAALAAGRPASQGYLQAASPDVIAALLAERDALRAARKPLTEAQIIELRDDVLPSQGEPFDCIEFARGVECAHGIEGPAS